MPITAFDHFNLRAGREMLDQLRKFYCDVVGLQQGDRPPFASFGYWLYLGDRPVLHLSEASAGEYRPDGVVNTFDHVAFSFAGRAETEAMLARLGVEYRVVTVPATGQLQLFLRDPAGNGVELNFASPDA